VIFDAGVQGTHISNQTIVYALRPEARSRLNSAYMTAYFLGGAVGSGLSAFVYASHGWTGVSLLAAAFPTVGWCVWCVDSVRRRLSRSGSSSPA
jgi:MFS family permease